MRGYTFVPNNLTTACGHKGILVGVDMRVDMMGCKFVTQKDAKPLIPIIRMKHLPLS